METLNTWYLYKVSDENSSGHRLYIEKIQDIQKTSSCPVYKGIGTGTRVHVFIFAHSSFLYSLFCTIFWSITTNAGLCFGLKIKIFNSFQPSAAFYVETWDLICNVKQMTGFYMKCNTALKWVNQRRFEIYPLANLCMIALLGGH